MTRQIIAITGGTASGKTTLANNLLTYMRGEWAVGSIASYLKEITATLYGVPVTDANKAIFRPLWQRMAEVNLALGNPERMLRRLVETTSGNLLIDDARFRYEMEYLTGLKQAGMRVWTINITCPIWVRAERYLAKYGQPLTAEIANHASEVDLATFRHDVNLLDNGSTGKGQMALAAFSGLRYWGFGE